MLTYTKAFVGAVIAGLGSVTTALAENGISAQEGVTAVLAAVIAFSGVAFATNTPKSQPPVV